MPSRLINELRNRIRDSHNSICLESNDCKNKRRTVVCEENKTKIRFKCNLNQNSEILGFIIDPNFEGRCNGKQDCHHNLEFEGTTCDGIIIFEKETDIKVIFWELKGGDVEKAISQICNSIKNFERLYSSKTYNYKIRVVIAHTGGAPRKNKFPELKNYKPKIGNGSGKGLDITSYIFFED